MDGRDVKIIEKERKSLLFEDVIKRLDRLVGQHEDLTTRAYSRSTRIANTARSFDEKLEKREDSLVGILHTLLDRLEKNGDVLEAVVSDLENAIM